VPYQEVLKWTAENSRLPDLGFWVDRVHYEHLAKPIDPDALYALLLRHRLSDSRRINAA
jgi:hypothetical protein